MDSVSGLVLTRQWTDSPEGLSLVFWLATDEGPVRFEAPGQEAVCFFPAELRARVEAALPEPDGWRIGATRLRDFERRPVSALYFKSRRRLFDGRDRLAARGVPLMEADVRPTDRFLMERFAAGSAAVSGELRACGRFSAVTGGRLERRRVRPPLRAVSLDIETDRSARTLYSIALYNAEQATVLMIGDGAPGRVGGDPPFTLRFHPGEAALLEDFLGLLERLDPDLIIGWNVVGFDLRRLQDFADRAGMPLRLGRGGGTAVWRRARDGGDRRYALVPGRVALDGIELLRAAAYRFENFSLEHVARRLLGRGKLVEDADRRGEEIDRLFRGDKPALARYNIEDCRLVWDIFEKEDLIGFAVERSLLTGLDLDRQGGSAAALDFLYLPRLHRAGFVAPAPARKGSGGSPGGYVMPSVPGIHDNVVVLDFKSLYPSIIRTFHVDPLALAAGLEEEDAIAGYDGARFSRTRHILPGLIEELWSARERAKADRDPSLSQAIKIIMNSFYGVLGSPGCRFFDPRLASSITRRGHDIIIQSRRFIEERGLKVIYGDTDSVFVHVGAKAPGGETGERLAAGLNEWWREKLAREHRVESRLEIEFETHYIRFFMPTVRGSDTGSKKRYAGLLPDGEVRFRGLETVRSDWSPLARRFQRVLYRKVLAGEPWRDYVRQTAAEVLAGGPEEDLVLRKRLRRRLGDYVKNVPPHVQAARKAEEIRRRRGLPALYESGGWVEYLMTTAGAEPRRYRRAPIDYPFYIDRQLAPVADAILSFAGTSMDRILTRQRGLFQDDRED